LADTLDVPGNIAIASFDRPHARRLRDIRNHFGDSEMETIEQQPEVQTVIAKALSAETLNIRGRAANVRIEDENGAILVEGLNRGEALQMVIVLGEIRRGSKEAMEEMIASWPMHPDAILPAFHQ
jgi:hypothetical protein